MMVVSHPSYDANKGSESKNILVWYVSNFRGLHRLNTLITRHMAVVAFSQNQRLIAFQLNLAKFRKQSSS